MMLVLSEERFKVYTRRFNRMLNGCYLLVHMHA